MSTGAPAQKCRIATNNLLQAKHSADASRNKPHRLRQAILGNRAGIGCVTLYAGNENKASEHRMIIGG